MKEKLKLTGLVSQDARIILPLYKTENNYFIYSNNYAKRKNIMKIANKSVAYRFDFVRNDYIITAYNGFKMFYEYNTGILKQYNRVKKIKPLSLAARLILKFDDVFTRFGDMIYLSASHLRYRNNSLKINARRQHYKLISFNTQASLVNKKTFYKLVNYINHISLKRPLFILYKFWRKLFIRVIIAGFRIKIKRSRKSRRKNLLTKNKFSVNKFKYKTAKKFATIYKKKTRFLSVIKALHRLHKKKAVSISKKKYLKQIKNSYEKTIKLFMVRARRVKRYHYIKRHLFYKRKHKKRDRLCIKAYDKHYIHNKYLKIGSFKIKKVIPKTSAIRFIRYHRFFYWNKLNPKNKRSKKVSVLNIRIKRRKFLYIKRKEINYKLLYGKKALRRMRRQRNKKRKLFRIRRFQTRHHTKAKQRLAIYRIIKNSFMKKRYLITSKKIINTKSQKSSLFSKNFTFLNDTL